jgi:hypothetical protein
MEDNQIVLKPIPSDIEVEAEALRILSKEGHVHHDLLPFEGKISWDAYKRGFIECAKWIRNG